MEIYKVEKRNNRSNTSSLSAIYGLYLSSWISTFDGRNCGFFWRKRQTTVQSSGLEEGYLFFHAKADASTTALAASFSESAAHTIEETSLLLSTSHT